MMQKGFKSVAVVVFQVALSALLASILYADDSRLTSEARAQFQPVNKTTLTASILPQSLSSLALRFPASLKGRSSKLSLDLDRLVEDINQKLHYTPERKVVINFLKRRDFSARTGAPKWAGGLFFKGEIFIPTSGFGEFKKQEIRRTLRHEYSHAVVANLTRKSPPAWFDEGLAQAMEGTRSWQVQKAIRQLSSGEELFPFKTLDRGLVKMEGKKASLAYAQSYLAVKALLRKKGYSGVLQYLRFLNEGKSSEQSLSLAFGLNYRELSERVSQELGLFR